MISIVQSCHKNFASNAHFFGFTLWKVSSNCVPKQLRDKFKPKKKTWHLHTITTIDLLLTFSLTVKPLGSGAFGQVFLAHAVGIVAFDPRGSTKRKSGRRRSRFGSTSRPYVNDKRVTAVAVKSLKGNFIILYLQRNTERLLIRSQC